MGTIRRRKMLEPIAETELEAVVDKAFDLSGPISAIVSNDHYPAPAIGPDDALVHGLGSTKAFLAKSESLGIPKEV